MPSKNARGPDLSELARGAEKAFANADRLYWTAVLIRESGDNGEHGAQATAYFLHQISLEELAKVEILGHWATSLLAGHDVDVSEVLFAIRDHRTKNRTNAYMLEKSEEERLAEERGDWQAAFEAFSKLKDDFHLKSNLSKNEALYVNYQNGRFIHPNEAISAQKVEEIYERNKEFLWLMRSRLGMLPGWVQDPEGIAGTIVWFMGRVEQLRAEFSDDPRKVHTVIMAELRERELARRGLNGHVGS